jgi:hypothetical protein
MAGQDILPGKWSCAVTERAAGKTTSHAKVASQ